MKKGWSKAFENALVKEIKSFENISERILFLLALNYFSSGTIKAIVNGKPIVADQPVADVIKLTIEIHDQIHEIYGQIDEQKNNG